MKTNILNSENFDEVVQRSSQPVLVDFHAEWCGPCRMMGPVVEQVAGEIAGAALVAKVNVDDAPDIAERYGISSIPTFMVFQGGEVIAKVQGAQSKAAILSLLSLA